MRCCYLTLTLSAMFAVFSATIGAAEKSVFVANLEKGTSQTIITYGTSLTQGGAWVKQLQAALNGKFPGKAKVINSAQGGMWSK
ncbi:MAG: hypothetical protein NTX50_22585 [Candidatus Sumerlaeota bacterium]|nr:hypothetical protein [Candidatus Sumerlaeota bacterium]